MGKCAALETDLLLCLGVHDRAYCALMIARMDDPCTITEKGTRAGPAIVHGNCGQFVNSRCPQFISANDDVAEGIAILMAGRQVGINESGTITFGGTCLRWAELRQSLRQASVSYAVLLNGVSQLFDRSEGGLLIVLNFSAIPFLSEGRQIEQ